MECGQFYQVCSHVSYDPELSSPNALVVSVNENAPYSYRSSAGSLCFCGFAVKILNNIALSLGWRLLLLPARHPAEYNTSLGGAPVDVLNHRADISLCPLSTTDALRMTLYDMVPLYFLRTYQIGVHRVHVKKDTAVPVLRGLTNSFDHTAWRGVLAVSLLIIVTLWLMNVFTDYTFQSSQPKRSRRWMLLFETCWEAICISLSKGDVERSNPTAAYRLLMLTWLPWVLIITTIVVTSLTATLSITVAQLPFDSLESFMSSNFHIISYGPDLYKTEHLKPLLSKMIVVGTENSDALIEDMAVNVAINAAIKCSFDETISCSDKGFFPAFDLGITSWISAVQTQKDSRLTKEITMQMQTLLQAGIIRHLWDINRIMSYKDKAAARNYLYSQNSRQFTNERFAANLAWHRVDQVLYVTFGLLLLSAGAFILEVLF